MPLTTSTIEIPITRITYTISKPIDEVLTRLRNSIKTSTPGTSILQHLDSREAFTKATHAALGPHAFTEFFTLNHGAWTGLFNVRPGLRAERVVFGNPLIAITMMREDYLAGLWAPVEAFVVEREDGKGTDVVMVRPSSVVANGVVGGEEGRRLREAAEGLDGKVQALWEWVAEES